MNRALGALPLALALACGCGGATVPGIPDAAADATVDAPSKDAARDAPPVTNCADLEKKLDALRTQAKTCCPICNSIQCGNLVDDVCCPISITGTAAPDFSAAVAEYKRLCGPIACPAIVCRDKASFECVPGADPKGAGSCR